MDITDQTETISNEIEGEVSLDNLDILFEPTSDEVETTIEEDINSLEINEETEEETETTETSEETSEEETQTETVVETQTTEEESETEEEIQTTENPVFNKVKTLLDLGIIKDSRIAVSADDEEGVLLSDFSDIKEDQLKQIIDHQKESSENNVKENYISKDKFSETQLKVIEIMEEGGDFKEIFQSPEEIKRPFEGLDLTDEKNLKRVILHHYINNLGHSQKESLALLKQKEEDKEVDTFANQIVNAYNKKFDDYLEDKQKEVKEREQAKKAKLADRRKTLSKTLKENNFKDSVSRKILDGVTKPLSENRFQIHEALDTMLDNPEENYEVFLHLLDKKSFNELYKIKQKSKETESLIRIIDALPQDKNKKITKDKKEMGYKSELEEEIDKIVLK